MSGVAASCSTVASLGFTEAERVTLAGEGVAGRLAPARSEARAAASFASTLLRPLCFARGVEWDAACFAPAVGFTPAASRKSCDVAFCPGFATPVEATSVAAPAWRVLPLCDRTGVFVATFAARVFPRFETVLPVVEEAVFAAGRFAAETPLACAAVRCVL